ncbi:MAG: YeeE/YedE family protein [Deltaproteobacteria bacterium RIFOXYD12_FULL_53_23]|nr:MAG: YeeE/YedE family protein [Deltaproteobacteria bacterium RIFOXYD12_FULL_53_23]
MSGSSGFGDAAKELYKKLCKDEWNPYTSGMIVAFLSVMLMAWYRPWGATGAVRNWADWILYGAGIYSDVPASIFTHGGSIIGLGFVGGAFLSACFGNNFAFRFPPVLEMVKGVVAGTLMGIGAALAGGCNVGGFYNAIGSLSAGGFAMMAGLIGGAIIGLKYTYWEMENITWGSGGAKTIEVSFATQVVLGIIALLVMIWGAYTYTATEALTKMGGVLLLAAGLGYTMQRGRWCMIQGFREPHMTGNATMAKSVALSVVLLTIGGVIVKAGGTLDVAHYVRGTFGWGGVVGGIIFGFGAILAGGCGTGTLWRVGEGQIKLWIVVPLFGISNSLMNKWFSVSDFEGMDAYVNEGITNAGKLGTFVYMPNTFLGYGGTLAVVFLLMALWWLVARWNEDSNKLLVEM